MHHRTPILFLIRGQSWLLCKSSFEYNKLQQPISLLGPGWSSSLGRRPPIGRGGQVQGCGSSSAVKESTSALHSCPFWQIKIKIRILTFKSLVKKSTQAMLMLIPTIWTKYYKSWCFPMISLRLLSGKERLRRKDVFAIFETKQC